MFFEFSPPTRQPTKKIEKKEPEPENAVLSLAPFTPNPKIFFDNVKIGQTATQPLTIKNPTNHDIKVMINVSASEEVNNLQLSWCGRTIGAHGEDVVDLIWTPTCEGAWRSVLHVNDGKRMLKEVPVVLKTVISKKKKNVSQSKTKRPPTYVVKRTSPIRTRKSPRKRAALPNITNIPTIVEIPPPDFQHTGTENKENHPFIENLTFKVDSRRETYTIKVESRRETYTVDQNLPLLEDSLENNVTPVKSPNISFERRLASESFVLSSSVITPTNSIAFNPEHCSTDEKSLSSSTTIGHNLQKALFSSGNSTFEVAKEVSSLNISTETYVKSNSSLEVPTKADLTSNTYSVGTSFRDLDVSRTPPSAKKSRLDSLVGNGVKSTIEADLWSNNHQPRPNNPFLSIIAETNETLTTPKAVKRKSDITFTITSPKRANLGSSQEWTKHKTAFVFDPQIVKWLEDQEPNFKKWLNAVLTPPIDLDSNERGHPLDVAKLWRECKKREIEAAPSRETISVRYHSSARLNSLRKKARAFYLQNEVQEVLNKVWAAVDLDKISIRPDREVHLDLALQADVMGVVLSYNPLWLRIGLETVYNEVIPLNSNSDITGLTTFFWERFMRDPLLLKKFRSVHSPKYTLAIKKFILKKFLALVYFLDRAKTSKLIQHDPCLFCKNAPIKESREALIKFAQGTLSSMGDVTKYLKYFGYVVEHKQTYLNEFDYAVKTLGVDLRDGVRLTRVMEVILLENDLSKKLRVPAISRLQKVHNVKVVFDALERHGFNILYDITPGDIVNGHKEKTLSFLWQIIYKFQTPLMVKSVNIITKWWRSSSIVRKREQLKEIRRKKEEAVKKIQIWFRKLQLKRLIHHHKAATKIQSLIRMFLARRYFHKLKKSTIVIQRRFRANLLTKEQKNNYDELRSAVLIIQRKWRATLLMQSESVNYQVLKETTIMIQRRFRAKLEGKKDFQYFTNLKRNVILVQRRWRAKIMMREYQTLKAFTILIQRRFRATKAMRVEVEKFRRLKEVTIFVQRKWRAKIAMREQMDQYQCLKATALMIQRRFRATKAMGHEVEKFRMLKEVTLLVQRKWRAKIAMREQMAQYQRLKAAAVVTQRRFRAIKAMRLDMEKFTRLKEVTVFVQRKWRAKIAMRKQMEQYQRLKTAAVVIQRRFRATKAMRPQMEKFKRHREVTVFVQRKWRANIAMRKQMDQYRRLKAAVVAIQSRFRATKAMKLEVEKFTRLKEVTVFVQRKWRANMAMREQMDQYQRLKAAAVVIQRRSRATKAMRREVERFRRLKEVTLFVQRKWRAKIVMREQMEQYQRLKASAVVAQRRFRAIKAMRLEMEKFREFKKVTIFVQRKLRANTAMREQMDQYQRLKAAVLVIQRRFRATKAMRHEVEKFRMLKEVTLLVQRKWRAKIAMREQMVRYQHLKAAAVVTQRRFRAIKAMRLDMEKFTRLKEVTILVQRKLRAKIAMREQKEQYQRVKAAAVVIQRRFRASKAMRLEMEQFRRLKEVTLLVQRKWRAKIAMRKQMEQYQRLKATAVVVQRRFRATKAMRLEMEKFGALKKATIFVQRKLRANTAMREQMEQYQRLKAAAVVIQRRFRASKAMRREVERFRRLKEVTLFVQRKWRANMAMREQMDQYRRLKAAAVIIQSRFRATKAMKLETEKFRTLKKVTIFVQNKWRAKLQKRIEEKRRLEASSIVIQKYVRGYLVRLKYAKYLTPEAIAERKILRLKNAAACKIQAAWKGYKCRLSQEPKLSKICRRLQEANAKAVMEDTLGSRCKKAVLQLASLKLSLIEIQTVLEDLDFITRRCKESCFKLAPVLPRRLYTTITSTNRSPQELKICTSAVSILINFYRFVPTCSKTWMPEFIEPVLSVMLYSCDKETPLFATLCTLFWFFSHNKEYKEVIVSIPSFKQKMTQISAQCMRKERMVRRMHVNYESFFTSYAGLPLPSMAPDWGLEYKNKPKTFSNSVQALNCLKSSLGF